MILDKVTTPNFLVDLDVLERNIQKIAKLCKETGNNLCPMVKTHKCSEIALLQKAAGATSFLVGTIDEAEVLATKGIDKIVFPYPIIGESNIHRVLELAKSVHVTISLDGEEGAKIWSEALIAANLEMDVLLIIDSGLHRFGVLPEDAGKVGLAISKYPKLHLRGVSTHPGHVYGVSGANEVERVALEEQAALERAKILMEAEGLSVTVIATGSTPTVSLLAPKVKGYTFRPGNYVFYDTIQMSLGVVEEKECAFSVLATIISNPRENIFLMDAGSKCLGLDKGAHGNSLIPGYGTVKGHPELLIEGLSEEVGKIRATGPTTLAIGDRIEIIPNHSCASANMTSHLLGVRKGHVEKVLEVDARGGAKLHL